jgi:hypothetical protein
MKMVYSVYIKNVLTPEIIEDIKKQKELDYEEIIRSILHKSIKFKYQNLKDQIETYEISKTPFDITIHPIDEFMVDVYKSYCDMEIFIHENENEMFVDEDDEELGLSELVQYVQKKMKTVIKDFSKLRVLFSEIMLNYEFNETEIRGIQKNFLQYEMLQESIDIEDFETSALIRDKIKNI